ncbi:outer membrane protein assembly factor BamE [Massilia sp. W12]|uniref:outer membrane protein assembly factor BamE domain-containing protein n=1 Tax=Massilia sp. W12 TaxID=3126507 RepID=UPI0030CE86CB
MRLPSAAFRPLALCLTALCLLAGCAQPPALPPGASEREVLARLGQPSAIYAFENQKILEYNSWPHGQQTWMAHLGAGGVLLSFTQSLSTEQFSRLHIGHSRQEQVLRLLGQPYEVSRLPLIDKEVWSYPYRESGVWDNMMHLYFDKQGILQRMENGPDDRIERQERMMRRLMRP